MTAIEKINDLYKSGQPILTELINMKDAELREKIKSILKYKEIKFDFDAAVIEKRFKNDEADKIEIYNYDNISINFMGIYYKPEHKESINLVTFDEHFKL